MSASRIILLVVALLAGGLAAFLATRGSSAPQIATRTEVVQEARVKVLVAKQSIGVAQRLNKDLIEWQDWPEGAVRPEYITEAKSPEALTDMSNSVARFEIFAGEPVSNLKLVRSNQGYLSAVLEQGMRGVSVPVRADAAAGGFVVPNDRVDVVLTRNGVSQTILANVKVLAIGTRLGQVNATRTTTNSSSNKSGNAKASSTKSNAAEVRTFSGGTIATLELTPEQGELIINATRLGRLSVVLRSIADFAQTTTDVQRNETSRAVRLIRFGASRNVMAGSSDEAGTVAEAAYEPEAEFVDEAPTGDASDTIEGGLDTEIVGTDEVLE